jgi:glyoxylase-like metal-dependent hydrolase (beta-lactamase superfamily II)
MDIQQIALNIYVSGAYPGTNVGLVLTDEGPISIDAPLLPEEIVAWKKTIRELADKPLRYTILTDHRPERALGATSLGAPVIGGRGTSAILHDEDSNYGEEEIKAWADDYPDAENWLKERALPRPQLNVAGRITLHGSPEVVVESIFGPGPGSIWVRLAHARTLFVGDIVVDTHPFLADAPNTREWLRTLVHIRRSYFPFDVIVPGRGAVTDKEATHPVSDYIQLARRRMRSFHIKGKSVDDLEEALPEFLALFPVQEGLEDLIDARVRHGLAQVLAELQPDEVNED